MTRGYVSVAFYGAGLLAGALLLAVAGARAGDSPTPQHPLVLAVRPQMGFRPVTVEVRVRQHPELAGREVCVGDWLDQPEPLSTSCWTNDAPPPDAQNVDLRRYVPALVVRRLTLYEPGRHMVQAVAGGGIRSGAVPVIVQDTQEDK